MTTIQVVDRGEVVGEYDTFKGAIRDLTDSYSVREVADRFWLVERDEGATRRWLPAVYRRMLSEREVGGLEWRPTTWQDDTGET